eukprot:34590_3
MWTRGRPVALSWKFVRGLETAFPKNVVAMMGNHDLFTLLDVTLTAGAGRPMGVPVSEFAYAIHAPTAICRVWLV